MSNWEEINSNIYCVDSDSPLFWKKAWLFLVDAFRVCENLNFPKPQQLRNYLWVDLSYILHARFRKTKEMLFLKVKFREETNCQKKNVNMDEVYLKKTWSYKIDNRG